MLLKYISKCIIDKHLCTSESFWFEYQTIKKLSYMFVLYFIDLFFKLLFKYMPYDFTLNQEQVVSWMPWYKFNKLNL